MPNYDEEIGLLDSLVPMTPQNPKYGYKIKITADTINIHGEEELEELQNDVKLKLVNLQSKGKINNNAPMVISDGEATIKSSVLTLNMTISGEDYTQSESTLIKDITRFVHDKLEELGCVPLSFDFTKSVKKGKPTNIDD